MTLHPEWQRTAVRSSRSPTGEYASSSASSSADVVAMQVTPTPPNAYERDEDDGDDDIRLLDSSSPSKRRRRAKHIVSQALLLAIAAFLALSLMASVFLRRRPAPRIPSPDNTFATLPPRIQSRLGMPALAATAQHDLTMPDARCMREFPLLFPQLDDVQAFWQQHGGITRQSIEANDAHAPWWGHARLVIRDGQLFVRTFKEGGETRTSALVHVFAQAVATWPSGDTPLPPVELVLSPGDKDLFPHDGGWGVTRNVHDVNAIGRWLAPDFGFVGWPEAGIASWGDFVRTSAEQERDTPWSRKGVRAFWRGFPNDYAVRHDLLQRTDDAVDAERSRWADVHKTIFGTIQPGDGNVPLVTPAQHCAHRYLVHVEGNSYSGRSRYLLGCNAVTIAHPLQWTQHFHPALNADPSSPNQNFVQLQGPLFDGLEETVKTLRLSDGIDDGVSRATLLESKPSVALALGQHSARTIAANAVRTMRNRYLTPAATMCYTHAALRHYAASMNRTTWEHGGPTLRPGTGVAPGASKGRPLGNLRGDIEVGVWRLLGSPNWPPSNDAA